MNTTALYKKLDELGRIRLSDNFFLREFLYSEIAIAYGLVNIPENLDVAVKVGSELCQHLLEPLQKAWGKVHVRSGYRAKAVNQIGNTNKHNCSSNAANYGAHIWDERDRDGFMGATACIVIPAYLSHFDKTGDWMSLAWWVHHNIPAYTDMCFFKQQCAFNIRWSENPEKRQQIKTYLLNTDTQDKSQLVNRGVAHAHYQSISPTQRYQACTDLLLSSMNNEVN